MAISAGTASPSVPDLVAECDREGLSWPRRMARLTRRMCEAEQVVIEPDERIVFTRTLTAVPPVYSSGDLAALTDGRTLHEGGLINNVCADWEMALAQGLLGRRHVAQRDPRPHGVRRQHGGGRVSRRGDRDDRRRARARRTLRARRRAGSARTMSRTCSDTSPPSHRARSTRRSRRFGCSTRSSGSPATTTSGSADSTSTCGRIWPPISRPDGSTTAAAEELLAEFFIALNRDSDLYPGIQQGDNGQTITLGGLTRDGRAAVNPLTWMALRVARDVGLIDPKINLRITGETDLALLELATELTRKGLGFPQYANDDVVIPALVAHGYALEDARDYTVAACWEFIIPGRGMDVVNIGAVSFPAAADVAIREGLADGGPFDAILARTRAEIERQVRERVVPYDRLLWAPAPYYSVLMTDALEVGIDHGQGARYRNLGIHGAAAASAADALAAVRRHVFELADVDPAELLGRARRRLRRPRGSPSAARRREPAGRPERACRRRPPAPRSTTRLADACEAETPPSGAIVRPGTGSAMYYLWLARGRDRRAARGTGRRRDGRRAAAGRPVRRESRPDARDPPSRTDQRPPVVRHDRLPARLQRRTDHAGAL